MVEYRWDGKLSMEDKPKNLGRAYLVGKLRERGLSRGDAVRILNAGLVLQLYFSIKAWQSAKVRA